jgi:uroporphyrin-3 C-methyltransferase
MHASPDSDRGAGPDDAKPSAPNPPVQPAAPYTGEAGVRPPRAVSPAALRALWLALLVLAAAAAYGWFELTRELAAFRSDAAQRLTRADNALAASGAREADLANALRDAQAKITLLESHVAESQSQQAALEALYRELAPSREELALTEVEQVLALASQQLTLAGNVQAALAALQLADGKLAHLDRPQFTPLRRALARDIDALKAVPYVDVAGISVKLDQLLGAVDDLPLARDERLPRTAPPAPPAPEPRWRRFLRDAWTELRSLVRIEVSDRPAAPLLTPQENYFLRENLRLRLLAARLALLSRDERAFKADLDAAREWLGRYFDTRARQVASTIATLGELGATPMATQMPDLARSLEAVRTLRAAVEHGEPPGAPVPGARTR